VNEICCKYEACDDVVPHYPIVTALASHYPSVGDNRTNDRLPCCVAEMDRYRKMARMGREDNEKQ